MPSNVGTYFIDIETNLANKLLQIDYPDNVEYVYNPLSYAKSPHADFVLKYANDAPKQIMFLGMNPGPWGMAQTGYTSWSCHKYYPDNAIKNFSSNLWYVKELNTYLLYDFHSNVV